MGPMDAHIAIISQYQNRINTMSKALKRQSDNMAFILNNVSMPDDVYKKFCTELEQDRKALKI